MSDLILSLNLANPDDFYAELLQAHNSLTETEMHALNVRLILANHIGDGDVLGQALDAARKAAGPES